MNPQTGPEPSAIRRAEAELNRCLRILLTLFPDPEFQQSSPEVSLEECAPLPEQPFSAAGDRVTLYTRTDLKRPVEEILTVLLHQAVHLANAFHWTRDSNRLSRHNVRFRDLAEQLGFEVSWVNARYGWAQTTATARLRQIFRDLALAEEVLAPFRDPLAKPRRTIWHCGEFRFPEPQELRAILRRPAPRVVPRPQARAMTVNTLWRNGSWVPMLRLTGRWLRCFGFRESSRVRVDASYGELRIQARNPDWR